MNPFRLYKLAKNVSCSPNGSHELWCARQVKFHIWSMTFVVFGSIGLFIFFGHVQLWHEAVRWHEHGVPFFLNVPGYLLAAFSTTLLFGLSALFNMADTPAGRMVLICSGINPSEKK